MIKERIIAAAILLDGEIYSVPKPGRHNDVIALMLSLGVESHAGIQGFLTDSKRFVNRFEAARIARRHDDNIITRELYSEDLW